MKREEATAVATRPLYQRLGGAPGISAIVDDVINAHIANPLVGHHFRAIKDLDKTKRMARDFFCAGAGGPEKYTGRDMRATHQGMNVSEAEFQSVVDDVMNVLRWHAIDADTQNDVLAILNGFRDDIVHG